MIELAILYLLSSFLSYILVLPLAKDKLYAKYILSHSERRYWKMVSSHAVCVLFLLILYPSVAVATWMFVGRLRFFEMERPPFQSPAYNVLFFFLIFPIIQATVDWVIITTTEVGRLDVPFSAYLRVCFLSTSIFMLLFSTPLVISGL